MSKKTKNKRSKKNKHNATKKKIGRVYEKCWWS